LPKLIKLQFFNIRRHAQHLALINDKKRVILTRFLGLSEFLGTTIDRIRMTELGFRSLLSYAPTTATGFNGASQITGW